MGRLLPTWGRSHGWLAITVMHILPLSATTAIFLNLFAATRAFVRECDRGGTVTLHCDNQPRFEVFENGRATDPVLQACIRLLWFLSASKGVNIVCLHIPGEDMVIANALSRAPISQSDKASQFVSDMQLKPRKVSVTMFNITDIC